MMLRIPAGRAVVFDLDDTLYKEYDYVDSGFRAAIARAGLGDADAWLARMWAWQRAGEPAIDLLAHAAGPRCAPAELLEAYRDHEPDIVLSDGALELVLGIRAAGGSVGIVTDGRSRTQRAKIRALGLDLLVDGVVVSEEIGSTKPDVRNFLAVLGQLGMAGAAGVPEAPGASAPDARPVYIADNPRKDFIGPNSLGWTTIQLDDNGRNVHTGAVAPGPAGEAQFRIGHLGEIELG